MFKLIMWLFVLFVVAIIVSPFFLLESQPLVRNQVTFDPVKIDEAKAFLRRNDPRNLEPGEIVTQWIDEREMLLGGNFLFSQLNTGGIALELHDGYAYGQVTVVLPDNPIGSYLNMTLILSQLSSTLEIESLQIGSIVIPQVMAVPVRDFIHQRLMSLDEYRAAINSLNGMQLLEDRMLVVYQWNPDVIDNLKESGKQLLVDEDLKVRLLAYSGQIKAVAPTLSGSTPMSDLIQPVFILAQARGGDPVEENRAALLALSFYFSGVDVARMLGVDVPASDRPAGIKLTLGGRYDFAQHFLTSAALTLVSERSAFADTVGLFKELDDASGGSGFSFTDIGADRAGVKVAELAIKDQVSATYIRDFFAAGPSDEDFMPDVLDLPELMPNAQFVESYGGIDDPRYQRIIDDIEARLNATKIFRNAP